MHAGGGGSEARGPILHPFATSTLPGSDLEEFPRLHSRWVPEEGRGIIAWRVLRAVLIEGIGDFGGVGGNGDGEEYAEVSARREVFCSGELNSELWGLGVNGRDCRGKVGYLIIGDT